MAQIEIAALCTAISERFRDSAVLQRIEDLHEITDTIPPGDMPLLIVYPETHEGDVGGGTQMTTFGGGTNRPVIQETPVIHCDVYIALVGQASLAQIMQDMTAVWDDLLRVFRAETVQPYFNYAPIKSFQWSIQRAEIRFSGSRFWGVTGELTIRSF